MCLCASLFLPFVRLGTVRPCRSGVDFRTSRPRRGARCWPGAASQLCELIRECRCPTLSLNSPLVGWLRSNATKTDFENRLRSECSSHPDSPTDIAEASLASRATIFMIPVKTMCRVSCPCVAWILRNRRRRYNSCTRWHRTRKARSCQACASIGDQTMCYCVVEQF